MFNSGFILEYDFDGFGILTWEPGALHAQMERRIKNLIVRDRLDHLAEVYSIGSIDGASLSVNNHPVFRQPDLMCRRQTRRGGYERTGVLEIGVVQGLESLRDAAREWLQGVLTIQTVILVKISEKPGWTKPNIEGHEYEDISEKDLENEDAGNSFSALEYDGLTLCSEVSWATLELWRRDGDRGPEPFYSEVSYRYRISPIFWSNH